MPKLKSRSSAKKRFSFTKTGKVKRKQAPVSYTHLMRLFGRKKLDPKYENYVHLGGLLLFMLLMVYVTYNDIARLVAG